MFSVQSIIDVMRGLFRQSFDVVAYRYDDNFICEVESKVGADLLRSLRYPEIHIRVWPNGKPPEEA